MRLEGKVALVTGAGSGFGRATCELFAREGARVVAVDLNSATGTETVERIRKAGGEAIFVPADVSRAGDAETMIRTASETFGRLDILFNNAGVGQGTVPVDQVPEELWDRVFAVNVKGPWLGSKYAVPLMKAQGSGVILNTASLGGIRPWPNKTAYSASKGAVIAFTRALAVELAPFHIRVCSISPAGADTPLWRESSTMAGVDIQDRVRAIAAAIPLGRLAVPDDIAYAALYLASDEASFLTGVNLEVAGGRSL